MTDDTLGSDGVVSQRDKELAEGNKILEAAREKIAIYTETFASVDL